MKKRIAIIQPSLIIGGVEKALINLLKTIDCNTYDVDLYLLNRVGELLSEVPSYVNVYSIEEYCGARKTFSTLLRKRAFGKIFRFTRLYIKKYVFPVSDIRHFSENTFYAIDREYDVAVAFHGCVESTLLLTLTAIKAKQKYVWIHGDCLIERGYLFDKFQKIICVSEGAKRNFISKYPELSNHIEIVYNVIFPSEILEKSEMEIYDMPETKNVLVSVGRLTVEKGFQMIPAVAEMLMKNGYCFEWYIIGDGTLSESIALDCEEKNVASHVHLLGKRDNPYPYMKKCSIYIQPSYTEGYCTTTNEARVLCCPVVATDVFGMREQFIHNYNGFIVTDISPSGLYSAISYLIDHDEVRQRYSNALSGIDYINKDQINKIWDK